MKLKWAIILFLFNSNILQAQSDRDCTLTGRDNLVPVWFLSGVRFPSAEALCRSVVPISGRPTFFFHSTDEALNSNGDVVPGSRLCLYRSNTAQSPDALPLWLSTANQACLLPTLPEDDYEDEDLGGSCNNSPYPCNRATGNKFRTEVDFKHSSLSFVRYYNSLAPNSDSPVIGSRWTHSFQTRILRSVSYRATLATAKGNTESFRFSNFVATNFENGFQNPDNEYRLEASLDNEYYYKIINPLGGEDQFHVDGRIAFSEDTKGNRTTYEYQELDQQHYLTTVTDHYGHSITFDYELVREQSDEPPSAFAYHRISKVTDQFGAEYLYKYDELNNLIQVVYPDLTENEEDNSRKTYHYENASFPNHLTGITDENGDRYANFAYNDEGKAILSELGVTTNQVGQEKIELEYQGAN